MYGMQSLSRYVGKRCATATLLCLCNIHNLQYGPTPLYTKGFSIADRLCEMHVHYAVCSQPSHVYQAHEGPLDASCTFARPAQPSHTSVLLWPFNKAGHCTGHLLPSFCNNVLYV